MRFLTDRRTVTRARRHRAPPEPAAAWPPPGVRRPMEGCAWTCINPGGPGLDPTGAGPLPAPENGGHR